MRGKWLLCLIIPLAACGRNENDPTPPRVDSAPVIPQLGSTLVVPVSVPLAELEGELNRATPQTLWSIDQREDKCVPAQRITACAIKRKDGSCRIGIKKLKVTPDLSCRIVGQVTRGRIALGGSGADLTISLPVRATVSAKDVGGIIKRETATGAADVHAVAKLSMTSAWRPTATVRIAYDWTNPPGVTILGKRITFVSKADAKLAGVVAGLERSLPQQLAKVQARDKVAAAWRQGFATLLLNRDNPPVWMRITPQRLGVQGYRVQGRNLSLTVAAEALAETFVGIRPDAPKPTPLPPASAAIGGHGLRFNIPVLADYGELEPVVERALAKRAARGITLPKLGPVDVTFGNVTIYATKGGRLAVGVPVRAKLQSGYLGERRGQVWLTGLPFNDPDSEVIRVDDLKIATRSDSQAVDLLAALFTDPDTVGAIQAALTENFAKDYDHVLTAARGALAQRQQGDFQLAATITQVHHGRIAVTGRGLFLAVEARGNASILYRPHR
ncbi:MAG: DUF4403 family protein [Sphingomonas sp.]|uniref:DUF4403 family protein n=1 Tax=Sphingomonas sp. TaxID=28214 RepID=UPI003F81CABA